MQALRRAPSFAFAAALLCLASACRADEAQPVEEAAAEEPADRPELGLMGTIPIYWGESGDFGELLAGEGRAHWARGRLEAAYRLRPLDTLDAETLEGLKFLLLAQPRALAPAENVALDDWVRHGGRLLLFADPLLTGESGFPIGDRRRPQDVILLSPILAHWGLALEFDEDRPPGVALVRGDGPPIPVNLPGALAVRGDDAGCAVKADRVLAACAIGRGRVVILADAALLDLHEPHSTAAPALDWLVGQSFGDGAGAVSPNAR